MSTSHPQSLGAFVRAHRERTTPAQVGLRAGLRRRAPGLRREELALLAGISPTWLTWIEQGRAPTVSAATLAALAGALAMTPAERGYLFRLAALHDPAEAEAPVPDDAAEALAAAVRQVRAPAYVLDQRWEAIAWNPAAAKLFVGWLDRAGTERNLLRWMFLDPRARGLVEGWGERAARLVAEFRADAGSALDHPPLREQVEALRAGSREFAALWKQQDVQEREGGERAFNHPTEGRVVRRQVTLRMAASPQLKLVMLV